MNKLIFFRVRVTADYEGRSMKTVANFHDESEACVFAATPMGRDMYGRAGTVDRSEIIIYQTAQEAQNDLQKKEAEKFLSKIDKRTIEILRKHFQEESK